jgi:hypothetical protein
MIQLFFPGAKAAVNVNGRITSHFPVLQGVRQGCPLAPYLFLIVGEVLNHCVKREAAQGRITGIHLPGIIVLQYANDTSLTLAGEQQCVTHTISTLRTFSFGLGLFLNWSKSAGYWWDPSGRPKPPRPPPLGSSGLSRGRFPSYSAPSLGYL